MIKSRDHRVSPTIKANYLDSDLDRQVMVGILKICRQLARLPKVHKDIVEERSPGPAAVTDDDLLTYVRNPTQGTTYHPVGTCRMGADAKAVVDPNLRVRGLESLYVVDASIIPTIISGNTNIPTVMIGEKFSDMIIKLR
jgi:choline dehydrogenase